MLCGGSGRVVVSGFIYLWFVEALVRGDWLVIGGATVTRPCADFAGKSESELGSRFENPKLYLTYRLCNRSL